MRRKVTDSVTYDVCTEGNRHFKVVHEFCDTAQGFTHRLQINGKKGEWRSYQGIAELRYASRLFTGVTDYYSGSFGSPVFHVVPGTKEQ